MVFCPLISSQRIHIRNTIISTMICLADVFPFVSDQHNYTQNCYIILFLSVILLPDFILMKTHCSWLKTFYFTGSNVYSCVLCIYRYSNIALYLHIMDVGVG